jgi:two-component system, NarL family, nitrate/nitrite response regulator NarL
MQGSKIELLLRSCLLRDILSSVLLEAGFSVFHELVQQNEHPIVVIDFDRSGDQEVIRTYQQRGAKIVVLAHEANCCGLDYDQIAPLSGILTYELSAGDFVRSLHLICSGERVFPRGLDQGRRVPAPPLGTEPRSDGDRLSPREKEMLFHLIAGASNKAIARQLGITEATVKIHLKSVLCKIRMDNRTQAAIWALANLPELDVTLRGFV